jgi:hypothetical protein
MLTSTMLVVASSIQATSIADLRCEYFKDPLGIDAARPQLSWKILSGYRGLRQTAYQILVASNLATLGEDRGDLWNSGRVDSDENVHVPYGGAALRSRQECVWKVRVWDSGGNVSNWSAAASWSMGLLRPQDWTAKWITASRWYTPPGLRPPGFIAGPGGWVDVDLGAEVPIDSIILIFGGSGTAPKRFKILGADEMQFINPKVLVDESASDYLMRGTGPQEFKLRGEKARHIRLLLVAPLAQGEAPRQVLTGPTGPPKEEITVRQMEVISGGKNVALMRPTREAGTQWNYGHGVFLVDGMPSEGEGGAEPPDACPVEAAPLFRKEFTVSQPVARATLYVAALGMADVTLNGRPVTGDVLGPPFTDGTKRTVYMTNDVTGLLVGGANVIGVTLGNGFFSTPSRGFGDRHNGDGPPRVLVQVEIEFRDGTRTAVNSDGTWAWARSEIVYNDVFVKYVEDRSLAKPGWDAPGYGASGWLPVAVTSSLGGALVAPSGPPIRVVGELQPDRVVGNHAYFENLSTGWPQVRVNGHAGQQIRIIGHAPTYDAPPLTFTLAADGPATLQPRFMYLSGPLDIEVQGLTQPLAAGDVRILEVHADLKRAGTFEASNPWLNQLYDHDLRTHLNYDGDQPMDPMREKEGWTQDAQGMFETAAYLTDVSGFYRKWSRDMADAQDDSGYVGSVLPLVGRQVYDWNSPWWSGVSVLLPWQQYQFYGDRRMLAESYNMMRRYVDFLGNLTESGSARNWDDYPYLSEGNPNSAEAKAGMLSWLGAGDWQNPYGNRLVVPAPLLDMPAWAFYAGIVSQAARILGNDADARKYAAISEAVRDRFNRQYLNRSNGLYNNQPDCETTQVLPLALGMVPPDERNATYGRLIDSLHAHGDHQGTGFVGLPWLLHVLTDNRETALANRMVNQRDYPGWRTLMHDGVFAEGWDGGGAQMPSCGGAIGLWLNQSVLGIIPNPSGPGFRKFTVAPQPDPATGLIWARGSYESVQGAITVDWRIEAGRFELRVSIPMNATATVVVPTSNIGSVRESGEPAAAARGVSFLRAGEGTASFAVASGTYEFAAEYYHQSSQ